MINRLKIGVRLDCLGLPLRRAMATCMSLGVAGVQVDAQGELSPSRLTETGRREFKHLLRSYNLELSALGCPLRHGLDIAQDQQPRIEHVRKVMSLSYDLGAAKVVLEAGKAPLPNEMDTPRAKLLTEGLTAIAHHGDRIGCLIALETGLESGKDLRTYLDRFDVGSLGVNLDPANLLINGHEVLEGVRALHGKIYHSHAKDARTGRVSRAAQEVPLGHGDIEWMSYLATLEEVEYRGWLTIERESGNNKAADIAEGVAFLRRFVGIGQ